MSSSSLRLVLLAAALVAPLVVAGCSGFRPVYGDVASVGGISTQTLKVRYGKPASRLDQIIQQDLALRLGFTDDPDAPEVTVSAAAGARALTRTAVVKPVTQYEVAVSASYTIATSGRVVATGTRRASASYTTNGQVLADEAAYKDATERAAHEVADIIRLSILAELAKPVREAGSDQ
jgi:hypothetical protein